MAWQPCNLPIDNMKMKKFHQRFTRKMSCTASPIGKRSADAEADADAYYGYYPYAYGHHGYHGYAHHGYAHHGYYGYPYAYGYYGHH